MYKEYLIKEVTQAEADAIIQSREPRGLFYQWNGKHWVGIDNMTGDAWCRKNSSTWISALHGYGASKTTKKRALARPPEHKPIIY